MSWGRHLLDDVVGSGIKDLDDLVTSIKSYPLDDFANDQLLKNLFDSQIKVDSFIKQGDEILTSKGLSLGDYDQIVRSGDLVRSLDELDIPTSSLTPNTIDTFRSLQVGKYPDAFMRSVDDDILADVAANRGKFSPDEQAILDDIDPGSKTLTPEAKKTINDLSEVPGSNFQKYYDRLKTAGKIGLVVGAITIGGLLLADIIEKVLSYNNACFLVDKVGTKRVTYRRVMGYTCGAATTGDDDWIAEGNPVAEHPLKEWFAVPLCGAGQSSCMAYCNMTTLEAPANEHIDAIPDGSTLVCRQIGAWEALGDIATGIGGGIGDIIGGIVGGFFGLGGFFQILVFLIVLGVGCFLSVKYGQENKKILVGGIIFTLVLDFLVMWLLNSF